MITSVMNLGYLSYGHNVSCCAEAPQKIRDCDLLANKRL